jgi:hypothetical protein
MSNTAIFILVAIVVVAGIFWLVIFQRRRGEQHREQTTLRPTDTDKRPAS